MFEHLLAPLDGTDLAEAVLPPTAWLAEKAGARVTLLHVIEKDAPPRVHGGRHLTNAAEAEQYLRETAARAFPSSVSVRWHVHTREVRNVAHSLVDHADEFEPDLIVLCAHGQGRLRDLFSGNIAQQVVHQGVTPVLLLRAGADALPFPFQRILVPLDRLPGHAQGLPPAADLAELGNAHLRLIHVASTTMNIAVPETLAGGFLPEATRALLDMAEQDAAAYLAGELEPLRERGIAADACVVRGDPADAIAAYAREQRTDLVALGTHGKAGTEAFWSGSIAQKLVRHLPAAFLLAPAGGD